MSIHDGHRQRLKKQFLEKGLDSFTQVQVLELLLFYAIPRKDTNPMAHELIDRFGSLAQVLEAPVEALCQVNGISENVATMLHLYREAGRYYQVNRMSQCVILSTLADCAGYLLPFFFGRTVETVFLLCLDAKCKVLCCKELAEGDVNSTSISVRKVVETALNAKATSVVLAHNHPSGLAIPSSEDMQTTRRIAQGLRAVEIVLADHVIVADDDYISFAMSGEQFRSCLLG